jgi:hypothetical protein
LGRWILNSFHIQDPVFLTGYRKLTRVFGGKK